MGFNRIYELKYTDYLDEDGNPVFTPAHPHVEIVSYVKRLWKASWYVFEIKYLFKTEYNVSETHSYIYVTFFLLSTTRTRDTFLFWMFLFFYKYFFSTN